MIAEHRDYETLALKHPQYFRLERRIDVSTRRGIEPQFLFHLHDAAVEKESLPVLGLFAGVHGIEAIGVKILYNFVDHLLAQTRWNASVRQLLRRVKIVGIPIVNPAGFVAGTRSNGRGVDLMRNAPVESLKQWPFIGGQRLTNWLPYFRGHGAFEDENKALISAIEEHLWKAPFSVSLDIHSGFGLEDFLWTPYAKEQGFPPTWDAYLALKDVLDQTLRHHVYRFEPQSINYCTSGDVWDFLYDSFLARERDGDRHFLPLTLEVGSWVWVKKSPSSALHLRSFFNPMHPHRERRVLRRHLPLLTLLVHAVASHQDILPRRGHAAEGFLKRVSQL